MKSNGEVPRLFFLVDKYIENTIISEIQHIRNYVSKGYAAMQEYNIAITQ